MKITPMQHNSAYQDIEFCEVLKVLSHVCGQDQVNDGSSQASECSPVMQPEKIV